MKKMKNEKKNKKNKKTTYRRYSLTHLQPRQDDRQPPPAECRHSDLVFHIGHLCLLREDAHGMELGQEQVLVLAAHRVGGLQQRKPVREMADGPTDLVVLRVGGRILYVVATHNIMVAVALV